MSSSSDLDKSTRTVSSGSVWRRRISGFLQPPSFNSSPLVGEERWGGNIAGAQIEISSTPEWYYVTAAIPGDVAEAFVDAATEVLDISGQVSQMGQFYEPGAEAVWNAWLELMADPY